MSGSAARTERAIHIGISGWRYPPWRGKFYPDGLPQRLALQYAARPVPTIQIEDTFYSLKNSGKTGRTAMRQRDATLMRHRRLHRFRLSTMRVMQRPDDE